MDYLVKAEKMPFRIAVEAVMGIVPITVPPRQEDEQPKTLILPEKRRLSFRLCAYLCQKRGVDSNDVNTLMHEGKLYEDKRGNVVFVGHDEQGAAWFASLRGTYGDYRAIAQGVISGTTSR